VYVHACTCTRFPDNQTRLEFVQFQIKLENFQYSF
jgi:hypothetical protein